VEKHAAAAEARIDVVFADGAVEMRVSDNGCGFRVRRLKDGVYSGKLGLLGMHERANLMGAAYEVQSTPGKGTHIRVVVPRPNGTPAAS
jgi:signal transduction histidine kinase